MRAIDRPAREARSHEPSAGGARADETFGPEHS